LTTLRQPAGNISDALCMLVSVNVPAIQVRDVPHHLHERLRRKAQAEHVSLSAYVLRLLERDVARPSTGEWLASLDQREPVHGANVTGALDEARQRREQRSVGALRH
jgi:hypothetical protein